MIKKGFFIAFILICSFTFGQKSQSIAYIDMEYILENVPEYTEAQSQLNQKVKVWQQKLDKLSKEIESLNTSLINEKALLTSEMILEREEDIEIKKQELKRLQLAYFGTDGDLYKLRKQMVTPVQDQVFNAIQSIAARKKYDFVLDKSSDLIMLYSNNKYDISELVLNTIVKNRKRKALEDKKSNRISNADRSIEPTDEEEVITSPIADEKENEVEEDLSTEEEGEVLDPEEAKKLEEQKRQEEKEAKRAALKERIKAQQEAREKLRDSLKKVAEERRAAKLKEIEDRQKEREKLKENNN